MKIQSLFTALNINASGLSAQRKKLDAISSNIANINTTRGEDGQPYRRRIAVMKAENIPAFETVLRRQRLTLETTRKEHFPFQQSVRRLSTDYRAVDSRIEEDQSDFQEVYDPSHPDADADGYVKMPNINVVSEMVDMISASRSYEANLSSIEAIKQMARQALDI